MSDRKESTFEAVCLDQKMVTELSGDFILPDKYPDAKRILRVRARPIAGNNFVGGKKLEYSGSVDYIVVFSAEAPIENDASNCTNVSEGVADVTDISSEHDAPAKEIVQNDGQFNESIHAVHFASDYSGSIDIPEGCEGSLSEIEVIPEIENCGAKLANPRKFTIRTTLANNITLTRPLDCEPTVNGAPPGERRKLQDLTRNYQTLLRKRRKITAEHFSADIESDPSDPPISEIITCDAEIHFDEARIADDGSAMLKGEVLLDCVCLSENNSGERNNSGNYFCVTKKIPVNTTADAKEFMNAFAAAIPGTFALFATGEPTEINASVAENSFGERRVIELDLDYDICLCGGANADTPLTLDAYSTDKELECRTEKQRLFKMTKMQPANFSVSESVPLNALGNFSSSERLNVTDMEADVRFVKVTITKGRLMLEGVAEMSCIVQNDGQYLPCEPKIPVRCELNIGDTSAINESALTFRCEAKATDLRARVDKSQITFDFEVTLNLMLLERQDIDRICEIKILGDRPTGTEKCSILLCYPARTDDLWQIAKRFATTKEELETLNPDLSAGDIPRVLMIPNRK